MPRKNRGSHVAGRGEGGQRHQGETNLRSFQGLREGGPLLELGLPVPVSTLGLPGPQPESLTWHLVLVRVCAPGGRRGSGTCKGFGS